MSGISWVSSWVEERHSRTFTFRPLDFTPLFARQYGVMIPWWNYDVCGKCHGIKVPFWCVISWMLALLEGRVSPWAGYSTWLYTFYSNSASDVHVQMTPWLYEGEKVPLFCVASPQPSTVRAWWRSSTCWWRWWCTSRPRSACPSRCPCRWWFVKVSPVLWCHNATQSPW